MYAVNLGIALIRVHRRLHKFSELSLNRLVVALLAFSYTTYVFAYWVFYLKISITSNITPEILIFELLFATS
jgi:hypothetical protein